MHPDHCEERLRPQAEVQMKRLNQMLATLVSPAERNRYDLALTGEKPVESPIPDWIWPLCGIPLLLALVFLFTHMDAPPLPRIAAAESPAAVSRVSVKPRSRAARTRRKADRRTDAAAVAPQLAPAPESLPARTEPVSLPHVIPPVAPPPLPVTVAEPQPTLTGDWLYVAPRGGVRNDLYPPEYIEVHIKESGGVVRGRYRARYRIADRAISPNVSFEFTGRGGTLLWRGPGRAQGEITLRLLPGGGLEVSWVANQIGTEMDLISGTATLVRKLD